MKLARSLLILASMILTAVALNAIVLRYASPQTYNGGTQRTYHHHVHHTPATLVPVTPAPETPIPGTHIPEISGSVKEGLAKACTGDVAKHCVSAVTGGYSAVAACMREHWSDVSNGCKAEVVKVFPDEVKSLPPLNPPPVVSVSKEEQITEVQVKQEPKMDLMELGWKGMAIVGAFVVGVWLWKGVMVPVWTKVSGAGSVAASDFAAFKSDVTSALNAIDGKVSTVVANTKSTAPVTPAPAPPAA